MTQSSTLANLSDALKSLVADPTQRQKVGPQVAKHFINFYKQNLITPIRIDSLGVEGDKVTKLVEKKLEVFAEHSKGLEGYLAKISKIRRKQLIGDVTKENIELALREAAIRRCFGGWAFDFLGGICSFEEVPAVPQFADALLVFVDILAEAAQKEKSLAGVLRFVAAFTKIPASAMQSSKFLFLAADEAAEVESANLGKRSLETISKLTPDAVVQLARQRITAVARLALKHTSTTSNADYAETLEALSPDLFILMDNPLCLSEFFKQGVTIEDLDIQDRCLECLIHLISRHSFEFDGFYQMLYDLARTRATLGIRILKILEIALKSRRLSAGILKPFLKMLLRRCLFGDLREVCWVVGLAVNLLKT